MKTFSFKRFRGTALDLLLLAAVAAGGGCGPAPAEPPREESWPVRPDAYRPYAAEKVQIVPWTAFSPAGEDAPAKLAVYVSFLDSFGCRIKSPAIFRFELYEHVSHSAEHKGKRIAVWPDIDLVPPDANNEHWKEFLRAYGFNLDCDAGGGHRRVLQATCICPNGRRLTDEFVLETR
jgi:hypothetical protein